jgi:serine/threonine protein kinase
LQENVFESDVDKERRGTFVGTVNYLAPEMIHNNTASMSTDIWSFGCIVYKMLTGNVPFSGTDTYKVYKKIMNKEINYPAYISKDAKALIESLTILNPIERLGNPAQPGGIENLKNHPFFQGCDFSNPKSLCLTVEQ